MAFQHQTVDFEKSCTRIIINRFDILFYLKCKIGLNVHLK
jgi:hypothetical protein